MSLWPNPSESVAPHQLESPWTILNEYANQVQLDTQGKFVGTVTETVRDQEVTYALYLVVPQLRDYMYRLFEARLNNYLAPYPVTLRLFAKDPKNHQKFECGTPAELRKNLESAIMSPITFLIMSALEQQIGIMAQSRSDLGTR
jgi:hypothetical protein